MTGYDFSKVTILCVDDNRHMMTLLKTILRSLGVGTVLETQRAAEALSIARSRPVDMIVTDIRLQDESGLDLIRRIRNSSDSTNPFVPIIVVSAHSERSRVEAARDAGANEYLTKPVRPRDLLVRMRAIIESPRPFVRTSFYFGPDRRRRDEPGQVATERRQDLALQG
ncbi:MAG: response regulator [Alphaproteobacteria bacterium]|nr:response regulator [Alphaproteobacteria bacterium]